MKTKTFFLAFLAVFALVDSASAQAHEGEDFLCQGDNKGPVLVRFHVQIDGKPLFEVWDAFMGKLFAHLDRNGDGVLTKDEALRVPPAQVLFNNVPNFVGQRANLPQTLDKNRDGKITRAELTDWYRAVGAAPLQLQVIPVQNLLENRIVGSLNRQLLSADMLNEKLFFFLDADKDGKLSRPELARAAEILHKLDLDEDETISVPELTEDITGNENQFASAPFFPRNLSASTGPLTPVESGQANKPRDLFGPDLEVRICLEEKSNRRSVVELVTNKGKPSRLVKSVRSLSRGMLVLELGSTRIELGCAEALGESEHDLRPLRRNYRTGLLRADLDGNGYLDKNEAMQAPLYRNAFRLMDKNGDGKLFEKEVMAYLDELQGLQEVAMRSCASLAVRDQGRGLFDLIDGNKDGRLSERELRQMAKLVDQLDRDGDGRIDREEIPHRYRVDVCRGPALSNLSPPAVLAVRPVGMSNPPDIPERNAPLWFQKMDRNHDGDVSRREFLGSEEAFRKIDQNGDGLISLEEAKRADQMFRKEKGQKP